MDHCYNNSFLLPYDGMQRRTLYQAYRHNRVYTSSALQFLQNKESIIITLVRLVSFALTTAVAFLKIWFGLTLISIHTNVSHRVNEIPLEVFLFFILLNFNQNNL